MSATVPCTRHAAGNVNRNPLHMWACWSIGIGLLTELPCPAALAAIEAKATYDGTYVLPNLSEQQFLDCLKPEQGYESQGCAGGYAGREARQGRPTGNRVWVASSVAGAQTHDMKQRRQQHQQHPRRQFLWPGRPAKVATVIIRINWLALTGRDLAPCPLCRGGV